MEASYYSDETYRSVVGRWCSLDRATNRDGIAIDRMLSRHRGFRALRRFRRKLPKVVEHELLCVTTDQHLPCHRATCWISCRPVLSWTNQYITTLIEHDDRAIKRSYHPMLGFA